MVGGGLMQMIAYGAQDFYLTTAYKDNNLYTCYSTMSTRQYKNFELIFNDKKLGKEYYSNGLINIYSINMYDLNNKFIFVNSENFRIKTNKEKLIHFIKNEQRKRKRKKTKIDIFHARAQKKVQDRQMKIQIKRR
jgi:hypothetical protein